MDTEGNKTIELAALRRPFSLGMPYDCRRDSLIPEVVSTCSEWSPDFINDLLPCAEKTALLYNLSYLCLANFPTLERLIRDRAVETQLLFGSSEAVLLQCICTSHSLVTSLFPLLELAVEKNKPTLAVKYLEKAKHWIEEIISDVRNIVEKYELHNKDVASSTSDVITTKIKTDKTMKEKSKEVKQMEETVNNLKTEKLNTIKDLGEIQNQIDAKTRELQQYVESITKTSKGLGIFAAIVPFIGAIVKAIHDAVTSPAAVAKIKGFEAELNQLTSEKTFLKQKEWTVHLQIINWQMKLATSSFDHDHIPDLVHLDEVQKSLTEIQQILIQVKNFWEMVGVMLGKLKKDTFVGEEMIEDLAELKDPFLQSIQFASQYWGRFGDGCQKASHIFRLQSKYAYSFLETSPPSLSKEEWRKQYESVQNKLEKIGSAPAVNAYAVPAITE